MSRAVVRHFQYIAAFKTTVNQVTLCCFLSVAGEEKTVVFMVHSDDNRVAVEIRPRALQQGRSGVKNSEFHFVTQAEASALYCSDIADALLFQDGHGSSVGQSRVGHGVVHVTTHLNRFEHLSHAANMVCMGVRRHHEVE